MFQALANRKKPHKLQNRGFHPLHFINDILYFDPFERDD